MAQTWYSGEEVLALTGHSIAEVDAAAAAGRIDASYCQPESWMLRVAKPVETLGVNEVQLISITNSPGQGRFTIGLDGAWSTDIPYNPAAGEMRGYLEGISTIGVGNIGVTKDSNWVYRCTFQGALSNTNVSTMVADNGTLPPPASVGIGVAVEGQAPGGAKAKKTAARKAGRR